MEAAATPHVSRAMLTAVASTMSRLRIPASLAIVAMGLGQGPGASRSTQIWRAQHRAVERDRIAAIWKLRGKREVQGKIEQRTVNNSPAHVERTERSRPRTR